VWIAVKMEFASFPERPLLVLILLFSLFQHCLMRIVKAEVIRGKVLAVPKALKETKDLRKSASSTIVSRFS